MNNDHYNSFYTDEFRGIYFSPNYPNAELVLNVDNKNKYNAKTSIYTPTGREIFEFNTNYLSFISPIDKYTLEKFKEIKSLNQNDYEKRDLIIKDVFNYCNKKYNDFNDSNNYNFIPKKASSLKINEIFTNFEFIPKDLSREEINSYSNLLLTLFQFDSKKDNHNYNGEFFPDIKFIDYYNTINYNELINSLLKFTPHNKEYINQLFSGIVIEERNGLKSIRTNIFIEYIKQVPKLEELINNLMNPIKIDKLFKHNLENDLNETLIKLSLNEDITFKVNNSENKLYSNIDFYLHNSYFENKQDSLKLFSIKASKDSNAKYKLEFGENTYFYGDLDMIFYNFDLKELINVRLKDQNGFAMTKIFKDFLKENKDQIESGSIIYSKLKQQKETIDLEGLDIKKFSQEITKLSQNKSRNLDINLINFRTNDGSSYFIKQIDEVNFMISKGLNILYKGIPEFSKETIKNVLENTLVKDLELSKDEEKSLDR